MLDGNEADDTRVAVLQADATYGQWRDIAECPPMLVERLQHYFLTYKKAPDSMDNPCEITHAYGCAETHEVIRRSHQDYMVRFSNIESLLTAALRDH